MMIINTLKLLMREHNVTQTQISEKTGIARPTLLSLIRNENKSIRYDVIDGICNYFKISMDSFLLHSNIDIKILDFDYFLFTFHQDEESEALVFNSEVEIEGSRYSFEYELKNYKNKELNKCDVYMRSYVSAETYYSMLSGNKTQMILNLLFKLREDYEEIIEDINIALNGGTFRRGMDINVIFLFKIKDRNQIGYREVISYIKEMSQTERRLVLDHLISEIEKD